MQVNEIYVRAAARRRHRARAAARVTEDSRENIFMRPGDVITLVRDPQTFLTYGATNGNAEMPFGADTLTLAQALVEVGGVADYRADARGVFVFRMEQPAVVRALRPDSPLAHGDGRVPVVYHLDLSNPNSLFMQQRFQIANRDLIYVSNAPSVEFEKAVEIFNGRRVAGLLQRAAAASAATTIK